ncbi:MAG TPA: cyclic nucleotide-binding domain-containing protein [Thermohalobaculum sp.]|nr:cyclic nucleotide-binding domain-containing protein [Thermohalobaculum sp.]
MSLNQAVAIMQEIPLFRKVDLKQLKVVAMMGETRKYRAGERLFEKGDEGDAAFIIISGAVDVIVGVDGDERSVATLGQGEIFGELAVLCDQPRTTAIGAHSDLEVLRLDRNVVMNLMREFPDISLEMVRILGRRLERTTTELSGALARLQEFGEQG